LGRSADFFDPAAESLVARFSTGRWPGATSLVGAYFRERNFCDRVNELQP